ncbi:MAG: hypothetical protein V4609_04165 [Pseudomonadota bacterium]
MRHSAKLAAIFCAFALSACTIAPILQVKDAPVATASGTVPAKEQVRGAIVRAGSGLGWQMRDEGPDMLVGTLMLRTHVAVVEIPYSSKAYSIRLRSSTNLDEKDGTIHKNYNGWVQNLTRGINAQLSQS